MNTQHHTPLLCNVQDRPPREGDIKYRNER
jgi:hypothetical protein